MSSPVRALIEGSPQLSSTAPAQTAIGGTAAQFLGPNPKRKGLIVQNTGTTVIYLSLGTTNPTATVYHVALKACTTHDDGSGGVYLDDSWVGAVQGLSSAGGGTCVITELASGSPNWNVACTFGDVFDGGQLW